MNTQQVLDDDEDPLKWDPIRMHKFINEFAKAASLPQLHLEANVDQPQKSLDEETKSYTTGSITATEFDAQNKHTKIHQILAADKFQERQIVFPYELGWKKVTETHKTK